MKWQTLYFIGWVYVKIFKFCKKILITIIKKIKLERETAKQKETEIYAGKKLASLLFPPERDDNAKEPIKEQ